MYVLSLNFKPFFSRGIKEEALSLLIFYYCICDCPCWWRLVSFVVIAALFGHCLKARMPLVEFYPIRASEQTHGWRHGKIVLFVFSNMAHSSVHVCSFFVIITNWASEGLQNIKQQLLISKRKKKKTTSKYSWWLEKCPLYLLFFTAFLKFHIYLEYYSCSLLLSEYQIHIRWCFTWF